MEQNYNSLQGEVFNPTFEPPRSNLAIESNTGVPARDVIYALNERLLNERIESAILLPINLSTSDIDKINAAVTPYTVLPEKRPGLSISMHPVMFAQDFIVEKILHNISRDEIGADMYSENSNVQNHQSCMLMDGREEQRVQKAMIRDRDYNARMNNYLSSGCCTLGAENCTKAAETLICNAVLFYLDAPHLFKLFYSKSVQQLYGAIPIPEAVMLGCDAIDHTNGLVIKRDGKYTRMSFLDDDSLGYEHETKVWEMYARTTVLDGDDYGYGFNLIFERYKRVGCTYIIHITKVVGKVTLSTLRGVTSTYSRLYNFIDAIPAISRILKRSGIFSSQTNNTRELVKIFNHLPKFLVPHELLCKVETFLFNRRDTDIDRQHAGGMMSALMHEVRIGHFMIQKGLTITSTNFTDLVIVMLIRAFVQRQKATRTIAFASHSVVKSTGTFDWMTTLFERFLPQIDFTKETELVKVKHFATFVMGDRYENELVRRLIFSADSKPVQVLTEVAAAKESITFKVPEERTMFLDPNADGYCYHLCANKLGFVSKLGASPTEREVERELDEYKVPRTPFEITDGHCRLQYSNYDICDHGNPLLRYGRLSPSKVQELPVWDRHFAKGNTYNNYQKTSAILAGVEGDIHNLCAMPFNDQLFWHQRKTQNTHWVVPKDYGRRIIPAMTKNNTVHFIKNVSCYDCVKDISTNIFADVGFETHDENLPYNQLFVLQALRSTFAFRTKKVIVKLQNFKYTLECGLAYELLTELECYWQVVKPEETASNECYAVNYYSRHPMIKFTSDKIIDLTPEEPGETEMDILDPYSHVTPYHQEGEEKTVILHRRKYYNTVGKTITVTHITGPPMCDESYLVKEGMAGTAFDEARDCPLDVSLITNDLETNRSLHSFLRDMVCPKHDIPSTRTEIISRIQFKLMLHDYQNRQILILDTKSHLIIDQDNYFRHWEEDFDPKKPLQEVDSGKFVTIYVRSKFDKYIDMVKTFIYQRDNPPTAPPAPEDSDSDGEEDTESKTDDGHAAPPNSEVTGSGYTTPDLHDFEDQNEKSTPVDADELHAQVTSIIDSTPEEEEETIEVTAEIEREDGTKTTETFTYKASSGSVIIPSAILDEVEEQKEKPDATPIEEPEERREVVIEGTPYVGCEWHNHFEGRVFVNSCKLEELNPDVAALDPRNRQSIKIDGSTYETPVAYVVHKLGLPKLQSVESAVDFISYERSPNEYKHWEKVFKTMMEDNIFDVKPATNIIAEDDVVDRIYKLATHWVTFNSTTNEPDIRNQELATDNDISVDHQGRDGTCFRMSDFPIIAIAGNYGKFQGLKVKVDVKVDPCFEAMPFHGKIIGIQDNIIIGPTMPLPEVDFVIRHINMTDINAEVPKLIRELRSEKDTRFKVLHHEIANNIEDTIPKFEKIIKVKVLEGTYGSGKTRRMKEYIEARHQKPKNVKQPNAYIIITPNKALATEYVSCGHPAYSWSSGAAIINKAKTKYHVYIDEVYLLDPRMIPFYNSHCASITMIGDSRQMRPTNVPATLDLAHFFDKAPERFNVAYATPNDVVDHLNLTEPEKTYTRSRVVNSVCVKEIRTDKDLPPICAPNCEKEHSHTYGAVFDTARSHKIGYPTVASIQGLRSKVFNLFISSSSKLLIQKVLGQKLVSISRHTRTLNIFVPHLTNAKYIPVENLRCKCSPVGSRLSYKGIDGNTSVTNYSTVSSDSARNIRTANSQHTVFKDKLGRLKTKTGALPEETAFVLPTEYEINENRIRPIVPVDNLAEPNEDDDKERERGNFEIAEFHCPMVPSEILSRRFGNQSQPLDPNSVVSVDYHREPKPEAKFRIKTNEQITEPEPAGQVVMQFARSFGTKQMDSANHTIATAIERYGASKPDPKRLMNQGFTDLLLKGFSKFVEFEELRPPTALELSTCKGESLLRTTMKPRQPDLEIYGQSFGSTAAIKCFNKKQVKSKAGADVWLNAKESETGETYIKGGQPISAQPKEVNHVAAPWVTWVEKCINNCALPGVFLGYGYPPRVLRRKIRRRYQTARNKCHNSKFLSADVSEQDTSKHNAVNAMIRAIYKRCGVPDDVVMMMEKPNDSWIAQSRYSSVTVKQQFQSGRSDTLLSNTIHAMCLVGMSFDFDELVVALFQGDDSMIRASNIKATPDLYHRLKVELGDTGEFIGFIITAQDLHLDIPRIASKLLSKTINDTSRHEELRLAMQDVTRLTNTPTEVMCQIAANTWHYNQYGFTKGDVEVLWAYLRDFASKNDAYIPEKLKTKALVSKIQTVFHFNPVRLKGCNVVGR